MLKIKNVTKTFGDIKALENVSFDVGAGEFVFLCGPSGAGKTTILRIILRDLLPDSGDVVFEGVDIIKLPKDQVPLLRQKIGVVFQDFKVLPERTVRENVEVALAVLGQGEEKWKDRVDSILKLAGLDKRSELFPAQLSGGELQRVSLARALVVNPKLILADEPTGNLDWGTASGIMDLLERVNKEGKTVIMATHNELIVDRMKKRVISLKDGKLVGKSEEKKPKIKVKVEEVS